MHAGIYAHVINEPDAHANISIVYQPTGGMLGMAWEIQLLEMIERASPERDEQSDLFVIRAAWRTP